MGLCNVIYIIYFDSVGIEHIPQEVKAFINNKKIQQIFLEYKHMIQ